MVPGNWSETEGATIATTGRPLFIAVRMLAELRTLHDRTERTGAEALAAVDAVLEIDAHAAVLAFADRSDRAGALRTAADCG